VIKFLKHRCNDPKDINPKFGAEVDVWNFNDKLVLSHYAPSNGKLENNHHYLLNDIPIDQYVAINAKSTDLIYLCDGLVHRSNYFVFDCAVPEAIRLAELGLRVFTRQSEYENVPSFYNKAVGVWMDQFETDWVNDISINQHLTNTKEVAIVSPELHGRDPKQFWFQLKQMKLNGDVWLCTKLPDEAEVFFDDTTELVNQES